jgi:hypothetical protein
MAKTPAAAKPKAAAKKTVTPKAKAKPTKKAATPKAKKAATPKAEVRSSLNNSVYTGHPMPCMWNLTVHIATKYVYRQ